MRKHSNTDTRHLLRNSICLFQVRLSKIEGEYESEYESEDEDDGDENHNSAEH
ncbi:MAG: hypothetical protein GY854_20240 [Deltaproteobacteria bacterium]|nr:hypothetical protein [Deltaproteobacteria bacterium]